MPLVWLLGKMLIPPLTVSRAPNAENSLFKTIKSQSPVHSFFQSEFCSQDLCPSIINCHITIFISSLLTKYLNPPRSSPEGPCIRIFVRWRHLHFNGAYTRKNPRGLRLMLISKEVEKGTVWIFLLMGQKVLARPCVLGCSHHILKRQLSFLTRPSDMVSCVTASVLGKPAI